MPIKKCKSKNKTGYKYGSSGKCYTGKNAKSMANKQKKAMIKSGYKPK